MAKPQIKKRFSFFSSTQKSPPLTPLNLYKNASSYFPPQEIRDDINPIPDDIRKSIENLEKLVLAADEYRDCVNKLSKISKNFSKCLKDYSNSKGIDKSYVQCIQFTSQFYEHHSEVQAKLNKALQKEFETLQKFWDKYSKKVEKDEKAHNDYVEDLDKQIKKISKDHEKKSKKENKHALESHDKYIASLTSIGSDIARAKSEYVEEIMRREKHTHSVISQIVCRLIEGQFASYNDSLKKCGPSITKVKEWASFAGQDTFISSILDLDSFLEMQIMTDSNDNDNSNDELISSGKLSRISPYKISQSIASISEMQKAVMNNKLQETEPLTEEPVEIEEGLSPQTPTSISVISSESVETTSTIVVTNVSGNTKNKSIISSMPPIVTAITEINPPISPINVPNSKEKPSSTKNKPLTPNLLSSLSIGIHDYDNPFFRDYDNKKITLPDVMTDLMRDEQTKPIMMINNQGSSINIDEKESSTKLEENNIVSLTPPPIYDKSRDITKNNKWSSLKKDQLKIEDEINSFPVKNTVRLSFIENNPENNPENGSIDKHNSNEYNDDESHAIDKRIMNEKEIHLRSSLSSFDTARLVKSFPIDLPARSIPLNWQQKSGFCEDNSERYNCDRDRNDEENHVAKYKEPENKDMRDDSYVTYPLTHSKKSNRDKSPQRKYNINPRRAYTEYPLPNRPSVADIRDRLLSSMNTNERILSARSTRDFPKPKQGYVNEVKSKFGGMNSNNNVLIIPGRSASFRDDMYLDQIESSKEICSESPSQSIINEQCNCHNCQEIRRVMNTNDASNRHHHLKDSFIDDLTTFGRNNF